MDDSTNDITIMDGSMGQFMSMNGLPNDDLFKKCWSARALVDENYHKLVMDAHKAYINAGANIIETNSYGVQPTYYRRVYGEDYKKHMLHDAKLASMLAVQARKESTRNDVRIFASIPPLTESYRPDLFIEMLKNEGKDFIVKSFQSLAEAALSGGADGLMLENMVSISEALLALEACKDFNTPLIVTLAAVNLDSINSTRFIRDILDFKLNNSYIEAIGFSCAMPEKIIPSLKAINDDIKLFERLKMLNISLAVLPNLNNFTEEMYNDFSSLSIKNVPKRQEMHDEQSSGFIFFSCLFNELGAKYIGACCGSTPKNIHSLVQYVNL